MTQHADCSTGDPDGRAVRRWRHRRNSPRAPDWPAQFPVPRTRRIDERRGEDSRAGPETLPKGPHRKRRRCVFYELDWYIRGAHQSPFTNQVFSNCQPRRLEIVVTRRKQTGGAPLQSQTFTDFRVSRPLGIITRSRGLQVTNYYSRITTHSFAAICSPVESDIMNLQLWPES